MRWALVVVVAGMPFSSFSLLFLFCVWEKERGALFPSSSSDRSHATVAASPPPSVQARKEKERRSTHIPFPFLTSLRLLRSVGRSNCSKRRSEDCLDGRFLLIKTQIMYVHFFTMTCGN